MAPFLDGLFSLSGKVAVVTGATVVFGGAMAGVFGHFR
jgi:NAD(P)-dependent dehydrogenase (short-subunit alcohol dehydrogenase family)